MSVHFPEQRLRRVPLFVLPGVHLFPGALLPLHIFEPRYVAMLEYVLTEGSRALVMATVDDSRALPGHRAPPVHGVMGLGRVMAAKRDDEGRWDIVVQGVDRVQLLEEHPQTAPYRQASVARIDDADVEWAHPLHERLRQLLGLLGVAAPSARASLALLLKQGRTPAALTDLLAAHAVSEAYMQRRLLETAEVAERLRVCCELMGRLLLEAEPVSPLLH